MSFLHRELAYDSLSALGFPRADDSPVFSAPHASRRLQFYPHKTKAIKPTKVDRMTNQAMRLDAISTAGSACGQTIQPCRPDACCMPQEGSQRAFACLASIARANAPASRLRLSGSANRENAPLAVSCRGIATAMGIERVNTHCLVKIRSASANDVPSSRKSSSASCLSPVSMRNCMMVDLVAYIGQILSWSRREKLYYKCNTIARGVRRIATPFIYARQIRFALTRDHERSAALPDDASRLMRGARRGGMKSRGLRLAPRSCASQSASGTAPRHECGVRRTRTRPCGATRKFYKEAA